MGKFYFKRLQIIRVYLGMSLQELSDKTEISKQTLSKYENGHVTPTLPSLLALQHVLNIKLEVFTENDVTFAVHDNLKIMVNGALANVC